MIRSLFVAIALLSAAIGANAQDVTCGVVITESITLTDDLTCTGTALHVKGSADNITVDLGGHTVRSEFSGPPCGSCGTVNGEQGYWSLRNGRVAASGAAAIRANGIISVFEDLVFDTGGLAANANGTIVRNSTFVNGAGIGGFETGLTVENSDFVDGPLDRTAISCFLCGVLIRSNTFSGYRSATYLDGLFYANSNVIADNFVEGGGISFAGLGHWNGSIDVSGNHVSSAPGDGIFVGDQYESGGPLAIRDNVLVSNGGDGIYVNNAGDVTVSGNVAVANVDLGIEAPGVTDGGGNQASGNGNPLQCVGVVCAPAPLVTYTFTTQLPLGATYGTGSFTVAKALVALPLPKTVTESDLAAFSYSDPAAGSFFLADLGSLNFTLGTTPTTSSFAFIVQSEDGLRSFTGGVVDASNVGGLSTSNSFAPGGTLAHPYLRFPAVAAAKASCGLGMELAAILPALLWLRVRRKRWLAQHA